ncbi:MAG: hypothetical protein E6X17_09345 [Sporomusaceae bacterium]|nr:hypothetical protein [Sporomusaceae bacterium]
MKYNEGSPKWDCDSKCDYDEPADMGPDDMDCDCPPKMSCKMEKECVKTFTCHYKLYRVCMYRLYKVCPRCNREFDYHGHKGRCPQCR